MDKTKIVYGYNPSTLEYIGEVYAHLCPVTEAEYLIPAFTTEDIPLESKEGFTQVRCDNAWVYLLDNRGKPIYNHMTGLQVGYVEHLSADIADGYTILKPKPNQMWDGSGWIDRPELTERELIIAEISRLESQDTTRRRREAILGIDGGWLRNLNNLIELERSKL